MLIAPSELHHKGAMRVVSRFHLRLLLASAIFLLLPAWAISAKSNYSRFAGSYESEQANANKPGPSMTLSLGGDGSATMTQDSGKGPQTLFGHWTDTGGQARVTFDSPGQASAAPMVFEPSHGGMQATTWDHAVWGKLQPPVMKKKNSASWHAKDHHIF